MRWATFGVVQILVVGLGILAGLWLAGNIGNSAPSREDVAPAASGPSGEEVPLQAVVPDHGASAEASVEQVMFPPLDVALATFDTSRIDFVPGSAALTESGATAVDELAAILLLDPARSVEINVATFSETTPGENHGLSSAQAASVSERLVFNGVASERLLGVGQGSSDSTPPELAAAVLFGSDSPTLQARFAQIGPLKFADRDAMSAFLKNRSAGTLDAVKAAAREENSSVNIVAYAWVGPSETVNHDLSHQLTDTTFAELSNSIASDRITAVGLGQRPVSVEQTPSVLTVHADEAAVVAIGLARIGLGAVSFQPSSDVLTEPSFAALREVARLSQLAPQLRIEVASHTYDQSTTQGNHDLSERQSRAVRDFLITEGVDPDRLESVAHGDPAHFAEAGRPTATTFTVIR